MAMAAPVINSQNNTPADLVGSANAAILSPAISTLKTALAKGFLPPFIGLSESAINRFPLSLEATAMGHLDAQCKNTQSTRQHQQHTPDPDNHFPAQPADTSRTNICFLTTTKPTNTVYTDQTGRLPHPSSNSNDYLMVAYNYNSNNILM